MSRGILGAPAATYVAVPFAIGVLAGGLHAPSGIGAPLAVAALLIGIRWTAGVPQRATCAAAAAGLACGALASALATLPLAPDHVARAADGTLAALTGRVVRSDGTGERQALVIAVDDVRSRRRSGPTHGLVAVTIAHARASWPVGARIRVVAKLRRPRNFDNPGSYDHVGALARRGIFATLFLWDDADLTRLDAEPRADLRRRLLARVGAAAAEPVRGYLAAVLLGAQQSLDRDTRDALTRTGLAHVVSVSGFHVAVVAGASVFVLRWMLLRSTWIALHADVTKLAAILGALPVGAYAVLAGDSVPAIRSFLSYGVLLATLICDRPADAVRGLALVAAALAFATPDVAADVSFELSFASVLALILVGRRRRTVADAAWWRHWILAPIEVSIAATIATAPLTARHFQQVSLIAPVANLLDLPLLGPATLVPGLLALPTSFASPAAADGLLGLSATAARFGLAVADRLAAWPWAAIATPLPSLVELALAYAAFALWWLYRDLRPRVRRIALAVVVAAALVDGTYWAWERFVDPTVRITFLSVGQGDAAVVELPHGIVMVIDGGGMPGDFDPGERVVAPFLRSRKILRVDVLVMSHPQLDHYGGLAYLATHFRARELWSSGARGTGPRFAALDAALDAAATRRVSLRRGMTLPLGSGVVADVLHPDDARRSSVNDASLVLRLRYGSRAVLFTGDIEQGAERALLDSGATLASDVLKVPHHGSATSTTSAWLAAVAPRAAVISSGADNRFGFPAPAVVERLRTAGATVWRTAEQGAVRVVIDGRGVSAAATRASAPERFEFPQPLW